MALENIAGSININLETVNLWLSVNKIKVNTHKSYHIVISYKNKVLLPSIRLGRDITAQTKKSVSRNNFRRKLVF